MQNIVESIVREAGEIALNYFAQLRELKVDSKGHLDLVTIADREVESFLVGRLHAAFPEDGFLGEEGKYPAVNAKRIWVIDPIDGTFNYVRGRDQWAISVGLYQENAPTFGVIYAPLRGQLLKTTGNGQVMLNGSLFSPFIRSFDPRCAVSNISFNPRTSVAKRLSLLGAIMQDAGMTFYHNGSCVISLLELAHGQVDGYIGLAQSSWDVMGALPILTSLGFKTPLDWSTIKLTDKFDFVCGSPQFIERVADFI